MANCLWCEAALPSGPTRGSRRRFCSRRCRATFHTAARKWAIAAVEAGVIPVAAFKCHPKSVHASQASNPPSPTTNPPNPMEVSHDESKGKEPR